MILIGLLGIIFSEAKAQQYRSQWAGRQFRYQAIPRWKADPLGQQVVLAVRYAEAEILNPQAWEALRGLAIPTEVDLIYTQHPWDTTQWLTPYTALLTQRIQALEALDPAFAAPDIQWRLVAQTDCPDRPSAEARFHGFAIRYRLRTATGNQASETDILQLIQQLIPELNQARITQPNSPETQALEASFFELSVLYGIEQVRAQLRSGQPPADSVVLSALRRNPQWKRVVAVADWTASMYPYGGQLALWWQLMLEAQSQQTPNAAGDTAALPGQLEALYLFNDGNDHRHRKHLNANHNSHSQALPDSGQYLSPNPLGPDAPTEFDESTGQRKTIGQTGGIYRVQLSGIEQLLNTLEHVMRQGSGGDTPENDAEAVLLAAQNLQPGQTLVLIADAGSPVRDLALIAHIHVPVHIILCGKPGYVTLPLTLPQYAQWAEQSGGSLSTMNETLDFGNGMAHLPRNPANQPSFQLMGYQLVRQPEGWVVE